MNQLIQDISQQDMHGPHQPEVLVVDDDELAGELASTYLKRAYTTLFVRSAEEAIQCCRNQAWKAILLDVDLGHGVRGESVLAEIRKTPDNIDNPIVALTAFTEEKDKQTLFEAGFTHFLPKPYTKAGLLALLDEITGSGTP